MGKNILLAGAGRPEPSLRGRLRGGLTDPAPGHGVWWGLPQPQEGKVVTGTVLEVKLFP